MQPGCRLGEPWSEAEFLPIVRSRQDDVGRLDEQGAQVLAAALGYASKDRSATGAVLAWNKTYMKQNGTIKKLVVKVILALVLTLQYSTSKDMLLTKMILRL